VLGAIASYSLFLLPRYFWLEREMLPERRERHSRRSLGRTTSTGVGRVPSNSIHRPTSWLHRCRTATSKSKVEWENSCGFPVPAIACRNAGVPLCHSAASLSIFPPVHSSPPLQS